MPLHLNSHFQQLIENNKALYRMHYHVNSIIDQDHTKSKILFHQKIPFC
jgi:hypothetical protein